MTAIERCSVPAGSLLHVYAEGAGYADCYTTVLHGAVSHADFVTAFYTTWVFKLERLVLQWLVAKPSTDADVARLAAGTSDDFAAWRVEARGQDQLLVTDFRGSTRSWLMVAPVAGQDGAGQGETGTRLYFGSAVVARRRSPRDVPTLGWGFRLMLGFHKIYSRVLLRAAHAKLSVRFPAPRGERVALWIAIAVVAAYVGAGGIAKLAGVPLGNASYGVAEGQDALVGLDSNDPAEHALTLLGPVTVPPPHRRRVGVSRAAALVDLKRPGRADALLGMEGMVCSLSTTRSNGQRKDCKRVPRVRPSRLSHSRPELPEVPYGRYLEYTDAHLALVCRRLSELGPRNSARGWSRAVASSELQIESWSLGLSYGATLDLFEERATDVRYYSAASRGAQPRGMEFLLSKKPQIDAAGRKLYAAQFFDGRQFMQ